MIEKEKLDSIAIAVPPQIQYQIAKAAIQKGLHVFAEKPFTANLAQARELYALAKRKRIVHGIDFEFPEISEWKKVKELIDKKTLGKLHHVSASWDWMSGHLKHRRRNWKTDATQGGGALAYYFSHGLNYLEHFAGRIADVKSRFSYSSRSTGGGEVGVDMLLKFKSGVTGSAHVSSNSPDIIRHQLIFMCERGVIMLENTNAIVDNFTVTVFTPKGEKILKVKKDMGRKGEDERAKIVRKLAKRFIAACQGKGKMTPSFADALRSQELIEKIRSRHLRGRKNKTF